MRIGTINFLEYLAAEEQNLLASIINLRTDFDAFSNLDEIYREPLSHLEVSKREEIIPSLFLFVHFHLYFSISCLIRAHFSESLASTRKAIDASLSAYRMILQPETVDLYKRRDKSFLYIKAHVQGERKKDNSKYPIAESLLELHDLCSEYGSHADISSFIHRVEVRDVSAPDKHHLMFHYFQFPNDKNEYSLYSIDTLWAFFGMLLIFQEFLEQKVKVANPDWSKKVEKYGVLLNKRRNELYGIIKRTRPDVQDEIEA